MPEQENPIDAVFNSITANSATIETLGVKTLEVATLNAGDVVVSNLLGAKSIDVSELLAAERIEAESIKTKSLVILDAVTGAPALLLEVKDGRLSINGAKVDEDDEQSPRVRIGVEIVATRFVLSAQTAALEASDSMEVTCKSLDVAVQDALQATCASLEIAAKEGVEIAAATVDVVAEEKLYLEGTPIEIKSNGDLKLEAEDLVLRGINSVKEDAGGVGHSYLAAGTVHYWLPPMGGGSSNYPAPPEHPLIGTGDFSEDRP